MRDGALPFLCVSVASFAESPRVVRTDAVTSMGGEEHIESDVWAKEEEQKDMIRCV